jgi:hypothetical protein
MDNVEAQGILARELTLYRVQSHTALQRLLKTQDTYEIQGPSGVTYQIEIQALWDSRRGGDLRVWGAIDDKGWSAFCPLTEGFIMAPDGAFIGEDCDEPGEVKGGRSAPRRFILFSLAAGGVGLVAWCLLDFIFVKFAPARIHAFDGLFLYFPMAVVAAGFWVFRNLGLAARIGLSMAAALAASVLAILLVLFLGIPFHLSIGGSL